MKKKKKRGPDLTILHIVSEHISVFSRCQILDTWKQIILPDYVMSQQRQI